MTPFLPGFAASSGGDAAPVWLGREAAVEQQRIADQPRPVAEAAPEVVLRPYQVAQVEAVKRELADNRSTLVVAATGTGKTTLFTAIAKERTDRVLILAHRYELLDQAAKRIRRMTGEPVELEQAGNFAGGARIVVGSIQTMSRESRLSRWAKDAFGLVVVDEAHHAIATTYRAVLDHFSGAKVLGVTATPDRGDRLAMGQVFESVAHVYDIADAIRDGFLAPLIGERITVEGLDLSDIRTTAGDLNSGDLDTAMADARAIEGVARPTFEKAGNRKTILFTTSVANAHTIAAVLNEMRANCARAVDGGMAFDERGAILRGYGRGDYQFLVNVGIATEGFDDPDTACVSMGRPTKSRALYAQCVGRGLRLAPGKENCLVLDFGGNSGRHTLVAPEDILAGEYKDEEIALAKEIRQGAPTTPVHEALEQAREEIKRRAARKVASKSQRFDPFAVLHISGAQTDSMDFQFGRLPPTEGQIRALDSFGAPTDGLSKRQASRLLDSLVARARHGLARPKQLATLQRYGIAEINLSFERASNLIDAIAKNRWRSLPPEQVQAIMSAPASPKQRRGSAARSVANKNRAAQRAWDPEPRR